MGRRRSRRMPPRERRTFEEEPLIASQDTRSSSCLEVAATEYECQGLLSVAQMRFLAALGQTILIILTMRTSSRPRRPSLANSFARVA